MSDRKSLQIIDKKDIDCSICLDRFKVPKTLYCHHSFCLKCLLNLLEIRGTIRCPKCRQTSVDLRKQDLHNLPSNEKIIHQIEHVEKTECEKPTACSICDNQPQYYCFDCKVCICEKCIKQHKILPVLRDHSMYRLDIADQQRSDQKCQTHCEYVVEFYCDTCSKRGCKMCEHVVYCYQDKHDVIKMKKAVDEFNQHAENVLHIVKEIKNKLEQFSDTISNDKSNFEDKFKECKTAIEVKEEEIIKKVKKITSALMTDLEEIYKNKFENFAQINKNIDFYLTDIKKIFTSIKAMNSPEETKSLSSHETTVGVMKNEVFGNNFDKSFYMKDVTPEFISFNELDKFLNMNGIGKITNVDCVYEIDKDDVSITVTKGQSFAVKVSRLGESEAHQLAPTLVNESGEELATEIEDHGIGEYRIKGMCNVEGDWKMKITAGAAHIKGSPVNIKVEKIGLVQTIGNISEYQEHNKQKSVVDVMLDKDSSILVSSLSNDFLKFNQSGSLAGRIHVPREEDVYTMHIMSNGHMIYSDRAGKPVVMCNDKLQKICSFGRETLKYPVGLAVNEATRILYVADSNSDCVFKFNVDDGRELGRICLEGTQIGTLNEPQDVTLTKDGHVIVADFKNSRIVMFDMNDKVMRILVDSGQEDGRVMYPHCVTIDADENMLISSNHKLQLFDKNGKLIKRIDDEDDGLDMPLGIAVICNRPRRVAVANHRANNVKIFNY